MAGGSGDRTPKQKMKMVVTQKILLDILKKYNGGKPKAEAKLKSAVQLQELLDATRTLLPVRCDSFVSLGRRAGGPGLQSGWQARRRGRGRGGHGGGCGGEAVPREGHLGGGRPRGLR